MTTRFMLLALLPLLGACVPADIAGLDPMANRVPAQTSRSLPTEAAWVHVGGGRPVLSVVETTGSDRVTQRIVLAGNPATSGENTVVVTRSGAGHLPADLVSPPSEAMIAAEMRRSLPDVAMRRSAVAERNGLGPFGFAVGQTGRVTCIYAWQWHPGDVQRRGLLSGRSEPVSIRVRLCDEGKEADLLAAVRTLTPSFGTGLPAIAVAPVGGGDALIAAGGTAGAATGSVIRPAPAAVRPTAPTAEPDTRAVSRPADPVSTRPNSQPAIIGLVPPPSAEAAAPVIMAARKPIVAPPAVAGPVVAGGRSMMEEQSRPLVPPPMPVPAGS